MKQGRHPPSKLPREGLVTVDVSGRRNDGVIATDQAARYRRLRTLNVVAGLLLAAEGVYMILVSNALALPVTASYLRDDPVAVRGATLPHTVFA
jgi:hypothetical protein